MLPESGVNGSAMVDEAHLVYLVGSKVFLSEPNIYPTSPIEVANITYKEIGNPTGPNYPSILLSIKASKLLDGRFNIGILETEPRNNVTARYLVMMVITDDGNVVNITHPVGLVDILGFGVCLDRAMATVVDGPIEKTYTIYWRVAGDDVYEAHVGGAGQSMYHQEHLYSIAYNPLNKNFAIIHGIRNGSSADIEILSGGGGSGGPYINYANKDEIYDISSAYITENGSYTLVMAILVHKFQTQFSYYVDQYHFTKDYLQLVGRTVLTDSPEHKIAYKSSIAITGQDGLIAIATQDYLDGNGGASSPVYGLVTFSLIDGPSLANYTGPLANGSLGLFMKDRILYLGGDREGINGNNIFVQAISPTVYGDWAIENLTIDPAKGPYHRFQGLVLNATVTCKLRGLNVSWMENVDVHLTYSNSSSTQWMTDYFLSAHDQIFYLYFQWSGDIGVHSFTFNCSVLDDPDWNNNERSITFEIELPDIKVTDLIATPRDIFAGDEVVVDFNVSNLWAETDRVDLVIRLNDTTIWTSTLSNMITGMNKHLSVSLKTDTWCCGFRRISVEARPSPTDRNWSDNSMSTNITVHHDRISVIIDSPQSGAMVSQWLNATGRFIDRGQEGGMVWAELWYLARGNKYFQDKIVVKSDFVFTYNISDCLTGKYRLTVFANGTMGRKASTYTNVTILNGPYWTDLSPINDPFTMKSGETQAFQALAMDRGTNLPVAIKWTIDGRDIAKMTNVILNNGTLFYSPGKANAGEHLIKASATSHGLTIIKTWNLTVFVEHILEILEVSPSTDNITLIAGANTSFRIRANDTGGDTLNYTWTLDNMTFYGPSVSISFPDEGKFELKVTVTSSVANWTHNWTIKVERNIKPPPPHVNPPIKISSNVSILLYAILIAIVCTVLGAIAYHKSYAKEDIDTKKRPRRKA